MKSIWNAHILFAGIALGLAGCGPAVGDLKGKVNLDGKSLVEGSVMVESGDGTVKTSAISEDGSYEVKGIVVNNVRIAVASPDMNQIKISVRNQKAAPPARPKNSPQWFPIPDNFSEFDKSGLKFQMKPGVNEYNIELKK